MEQVIDHVEAMKNNAKVLPDGIYVTLPEDVYHADPALGSTSLKKLVDNAPDFWWDSWMNPAREPEVDTPAKVFGRAVHKCVLEGRAAFQEEYGPVPTPDEYDGCLRTADDLKAFLRDRQQKLTGSKSELVDRASALADCPVIFDKVLEAFEESKRKPLKRDDFNRILAASAFIRANGNLRNAFEGGYPEVSVFWTAGGVRFKCRFDYLKMRAIADLKSIRNPLNKPFERACQERIAGLDYAISAEHYMEGRRQMTALLKKGAVFNAPDDPNFMPWLIQVTGIKEFAFVLVFWQAEGAPISKGFKLSPGNPLLASARANISKAIANYKTFMEKFGTDTAWVPTTELTELDETDMPVWYQQRLMTGA